MVEMDSSLVWFRRDLRLEDHAALHAALTAGGPVHCAFVFDTDILDGLADRADRRVVFIHAGVAKLKAELERHGGGLHVVHGPARTAIPALAGRLAVAAVHANRDYEPAARRRDAAVAEALAGQGRRLALHKDQVIFDTDEVLTGAGRPYHVFSPYKRAWLARLTPIQLAPYPIAEHLGRLARAGTAAMPSLSDLGCHPVDLDLADPDALWRAFQCRIDSYHEARDYPALDATSHLSVHLRFGTLSIRELARFAHERGSAGAQAWLAELIWREFYQMLLWHYPDTVEHAFQAKFDAIEWPNPPGHFEAWCAARTGYPIVDAAMRQLDRTGFMPNRLRMVAASFLVKDLHCDWRLGERWFAAKLLDYDQAANVGNWQWCASTGTDAQPWFRIFNPVSQSEKFDPEGRYIRRWLPELAGVPDRHIHAPWTLPGEQWRRFDYPPPLVDHARARAVTLETYKACR
ncbi:MAG: deoxyribodipyrimidine photo-lyase [Thiobacillus sp.]|nr:deoxyribodipyrimidine photo-lyase [Thiobacillus sp.]